VSIYSDKKIAAELRNIGGNFLPPKIYQNCEDCTKTQFDQYTVCDIFVIDAKQALQLVLGTTAQGNVCKMYFLRSTCPLNHFQPL
jgi:hypothetical protein